MGGTEKILSKRKSIGGIVLIFVTVGTHEQGMDRLLIELDKLIYNKKINEEVFAQIGYSEYKPKFYKYKEMIDYDEMDLLVKNSDIVITHGGPGSIFHAIHHKKIPVVVPRNPQFKEHVDNHQILFTKKMEGYRKVIGLYNINDLEYKIKNYQRLSKQCNIDKSTKKDFIIKFERLVNGLL